MPYLFVPSTCVWDPHLQVPSSPRCTAQKILEFSRDVCPCIPAGQARMKNSSIEPQTTPAQRALSIPRTSHSEEFPRFFQKHDVASHTRRTGGTSSMFRLRMKLVSYQKGLPSVTRRSDRVPSPTAVHCAPLNPRRPTVEAWGKIFRCTSWAEASPWSRRGNAPPPAGARTIGLQVVVVVVVVVVGGGSGRW